MCVEVKFNLFTDVVRADKIYGVTFKWLARMCEVANDECASVHSVCAYYGNNIICKKCPKHQRWMCGLISDCLTSFQIRYIIRRFGVKTTL